MKRFLNESRRQRLVSELCNLGMEFPQACRFASHTDDLRQLDKWLAKVVTHLHEEVARLNDAIARQNIEQTSRLEAYVAATLKIFRAYSAEVRDRNISAVMMPRTTNRIGLALERIEQSKAAALDAMVQPNGRPN